MTAPAISVNLRRASTTSYECAYPALGPKKIDPSKALRYSIGGSARLS